MSLYLIDSHLVLDISSISQNFWSSWLIERAVYSQTSVVNNDICSSGMGPLIYHPNTVSCANKFPATLWRIPFFKINGKMPLPITISIWAGLLKCGSAKSNKSILEKSLILKAIAGRKLVSFERIIWFSRNSNQRCAFSWIFNHFTPHTNYLVLKFFKWKFELSLYFFW